MRTLNQYLSNFEPDAIKMMVPGDILFEQNSQARDLFVVKKGRIKLIRNTQDGHLVVLYVAIAGDSLAEAALFSDIYHCQAVADQPSEIMCFDKDKLLKHLSSDPVASFKFIESLAKQVQSLRLLIELRNIRSPRERLIQYFLSICDKNRCAKIPSSYKDIAHQLGMTHETLYRKLSELEKQDIISRKDNIIYLNNI